MDIILFEPEGTLFSLHLVAPEIVAQFQPGRTDENTEPIDIMYVLYTPDITIKIINTAPDKGDRVVKYRCQDSKASLFNL